jgi:predicted alpha/beta hydrolase family esterase
MSGRSFLLLHGWQNRRPPEHWQHWLAAELEVAGAQVVYPQLPKPDAPSLEEWLSRLDQHLAELTGPERTVIGHSLGAILWLQHAVRAVRPGPADRALLVSPPGPEPPAPEIAAFFDLELDGAAVAAAAGRTEVVCSDDDPYSRAGAEEGYAKPLGLVCRVIPGAGHINPDSGYGPWPEILEWALSDKPGELFVAKRRESR